MVSDDHISACFDPICPNLPDQKPASDYSLRFTAGTQRTIVPGNGFAGFLLTTLKCLMNQSIQSRFYTGGFEDEQHKQMGLSF